MEPTTQPYPRQNGQEMEAEAWPWTWPWTWGLAEYPPLASGSTMLSVGSRQGQLRGR